MKDDALSLILNVFVWIKLTVTSCGMTAGGVPGPICAKSRVLQAIIAGDTAFWARIKKCPSYNTKFTKDPEKSESIQDLHTAVRILADRFDNTTCINPDLQYAHSNFFLFLVRKP